MASGIASIGLVVGPFLGVALGLTVAAGVFETDWVGVMVLEGAGVLDGEGVADGCMVVGVTVTVDVTVGDGGTSEGVADCAKTNDGREMTREDRTNMINNCFLL